MKILAQLSNRGPLGEFGTEALPAALMVGPAIPSQWALQPTLLFFLQLTQWALQSTLLFFLVFSQWAPQSPPTTPRLSNTRPPFLLFIQVKSNE